MIVRVARADRAAHATRPPTLSSRALSRAGPRVPPSRRSVSNAVQALVAVVGGGLPSHFSSCGVSCCSIASNRWPGKWQHPVPEAVVVACGAIGSSELLLRNRIKSRFPIGQGFHFLGGTLVAADSHVSGDVCDNLVPRGYLTPHSSPASFGLRSSQRRQRRSVSSAAHSFVECLAATSLLQ